MNNTNPATLDVNSRTVPTDGTAVGCGVEELRCDGVTGFTLFLVSGGAQT